MQYSQNCENYKNSINNSKNNNGFYLKNDFTKINNTNINCLDNTNKKANDNYLNNENLAPLKNSYNNVSCKSNVICNSDLRYKNNATQNSNIGCNNSASSKRGLSQSKACYKSTAYYENGINYKSCTTGCSATTKICLWLFLFVACFAVTIGFGCLGSGNGNASLNVVPAIETASAAGETWSGSGAQTDPYQISTLSDLNLLATNCNAGQHYSGKYFKVTNNITITASEWVPIAVDFITASTQTNYFSGIFDGGASENKTITIDATTGSVPANFTVSARTDEASFGGLFGYVSNGEIKNIKLHYNIGDYGIFLFNKTKDGATAHCRGSVGGIVGACNASTISDCSISGDEIKIPYWGSYARFGGIVGRGIGNSIVKNCTTNSDIWAGGASVGSVGCTTGLGGLGGIVAELEGTISFCEVKSSVTRNGLSGASNCIVGAIGAVVGKATYVDNCIFSGNKIFLGSDFIGRWGGIVGEATKVTNCKVINRNEGNTDKIKINSTADTATKYCGVVVGIAQHVENCYIDANIDTIYCSAVDDPGYSGLFAGQATIIKNCSANVTIDTVSSHSSSFSYFGFIAGNVISATTGSTTITPSATNCFVNAEVTSVTGSDVYAIAMQPKHYDSSTRQYVYDPFNAYNCVVITSVNGVTSSYSLTDASTSTADTTNGLYSLTSTNVNLNELKNKTTYTTGTSNFSWSSSAPWDFTNTWAIKSTMNGGYPILQMILPTCNVALNLTTNLSGSTLGTTTGTSGAGTTSGVGTNPAQFIIYRFDESGNLVNQFVVGNGSTVTFEVDKNKSFTIMINYKLYMVTTIDAESTNKKTFTPTADTTINIFITAPANVNNWIVV